MELLTQMELRVLAWIATLQNPVLDVAMPAITALGDHGIFPIVLAVVLLAIKKTRAIGISLALSLVSVLLSCNLLLKPLVARIRPYELVDVSLLVAKLSDYSFPSGHTTVMFATATVLSYYCQSWQGLFYTIAILVGFSRLYLYVHFPSDVLVGAILGVLCGQLGLLVGKRLQRKKRVD